MEDVEVQLLQATRPEVGDEVTVLWYGEEYMCKVTMVEDTRVKVHYKGNNAGHDQWVPLSKPGGGAVAVRKDLVQLHKQHKSKPVVGEEVTVLWNSEEYKCTVKMVEDTRVKVNYKGYNADHDQWVLLSKPPGGGALAVRRDLFREPSTEAYSNGPLVVDGFIIEEQVVEEAEEEEQSYLLSQDEKLECAVCGEMFSRGHFKPAIKHWKEQHGLRRQGPNLNLDLLSLISAGYLK